MAGTLDIVVSIGRSVRQWDDLPLWVSLILMFQRPTSGSRFLVTHSSISASFRLVGTRI